jgi:hypothetical protein
LEQPASPLTTAFGQVPGDKQREEALEEFRAIKTHVDVIEEQVPVKLALGNHDTHPDEDTPELFHTIFPERPEYHAFEEKGVPFVFLNGGSSGNLDAEQRGWFRREVEHRFDENRSFVTVCHQPSLGRVTNERGITQAFRQAMPDVNGDLWMIGGHHHKNSDECYQLPQGIITQATITTPNPTVWGTEKPGYWIYGFSKGRLVIRVFRRIGQGYALAPAPPKNMPRPLRLPFEDSQTLWQVLVGEGDESFRKTTDARWCQNYWYYTKKLVYEFPLSLGGGKTRRIGILNTPESEVAPAFGLSPDGSEWIEALASNRVGSMTILKIPAALLQAKSIFVRLERCAVSGFALLA